MKKLTLTVVHKLPNRVRFKLSVPINNLQSFSKALKTNGGSLNLRYSPVSLTLLITFNSNEVFLQEIIHRVATAYSVQNGMFPVKLITDSQYKSLNSLSLYAGASIVISSINQIFNKKDLKLQNSMNMFSMGITLTSIIEHAYFETKKKGMFDLEILPAFYLLKSFINSPNIISVGLMWLTTFGRHLISSPNRAEQVRVLRIKDNKKNDYSYVANVYDDNSVENFTDVIYHVFFKRNKSSFKTNEKYITLTEK